MSQKDYNLEIVENLLKGSNHIRGLAKDLETNQTTISRKMKELEEKNVVDYKQEGKNKVYFLKKTLEAREYAYMTENHKLLKMLDKYPLLKKTIQKIKSDKRIELAVVFGSYAKGLANKDSDMDIYIETTDSKLKREIEVINPKLSIKTGEYDKKSILIKEIEKNHVIIKGVEEYYEKNGFFE